MRMHTLGSLKDMPGRNGSAIVDATFKSYDAMRCSSGTDLGVSKRGSKIAK